MAFISSAATASVTSAPTASISLCPGGAAPLTSWISTPVAVPTSFPSGTPQTIINAFFNNVGCKCDPCGNSYCDNCLTSSVAYLQENRDHSAIVGILFVASLTVIIMCLRMYTRYRIAKTSGLDDILALVTMILFVPFVYLCVWLIKLGSGRHLQWIQFVLSQDNDVVNLTETLDFAAHIIYTTALMFCRLSGLWFYLRLTDRCNNEFHHRLIIKGTMVFVILAYVPQVMLIVFHCLPVTSLWPYGWQTSEYATFSGHISWGAVYVTNSGISIVCDVLMLSIPTAIICYMQCDTPTKWMLAAMLCPGAPVLILSAIRMYLVVEGQWQEDQSWWYNPMLTIECSEIAGTLIALSLPTMKQLFFTLQQYFFGDEIDSEVPLFLQRTRDQGNSRFSRFMRSIGLKRRNVDASGTCRSCGHSRSAQAPTAVATPRSRGSDNVTLVQSNADVERAAAAPPPPHHGGGNRTTRISYDVQNLKIES